MNPDDPEHRIAELERQAAEPPAHSRTQPIALPAAVPPGHVADPRARRQAQFAAHARAMYPQLRRQRRQRRLVGWIIGGLSVAGGLWLTALALSLVFFPETTSWMSEIVCSSPYQLEYDESSVGSHRSVNFRCVDGQDQKNVDGPVLGLQAAALALLIALVTALAAAIGLLVWRVVGRRR